MKDVPIIGSPESRYGLKHKDLQIIVMPFDVKGTTAIIVQVIHSPSLFHVTTPPVPHPAIGIELAYAAIRAFLDKHAELTSPTTSDEETLVS